MDWSPYTVGGATRPDAISGLDPNMQQAVWNMLQAAQNDGLNLRITSAYRSPELQAQLWENALAKYGDPEIADNWVARPGASMHNKGMAVDFAGPGGLLRDANSPEAQWIRANAERFGLAVPMEWEPWQVELAGARSGAVAANLPLNMGQPTQNALAPQNGALAGFERMQQFNALASMMPRYEAPRLEAFQLDVRPV
jgi:hypothetical protein